MSLPTSKYADAVQTFLSVRTWQDGETLVSENRDVFLNPALSQLMLERVPEAVRKEDQWQVANLQISRRILDDCRSKGIHEGFEIWLRPFPSEVRLSLYKQFMDCSTEERVKFRINFPEVEFEVLQTRNAAISMKLYLNSTLELSVQVEIIKEELRKVHPLFDTYKWAYLKNYLGKVLALSDAPGRVEHLQTAIQHWSEALEILQPNLIDEGMLWSEIQVNLAMAYTDHRMPGNRPVNFETAEACINEALKYYSPKFTPLEWGTTQLRMAQVYIEHPQRNNQKAIEHMRIALDIMSRYSEDPLQVAKIQSDLGNMYLATRSDNYSDNIEAAIVCLEDALKIFMEHNDLESQRRIYLALSDAYHKRTKGDLKTNQERASRYLKKGLANE